MITPVNILHMLDCSFPFFILESFFLGRKEEMRCGGYKQRDNKRNFKKNILVVFCHVTEINSGLYYKTFIFSVNFLVIESATHLELFSNSVLSSPSFIFFGIFQITKKKAKASRIYKSFGFLMNQ